MRNQFFYTLEYTITPAAGAPAGTKPVVKTRMASFNIDKVIRSMETEDNKLIVILDDFHEETRQSVVNNMKGKPIVKMETQMLQSEIHLNEKDKLRFRRATSYYEVDRNLTLTPQEPNGV
jgi:hypothetical protein